MNYKNYRIIIFTYFQFETILYAIGNCKAAKTEIVWARDKIGRPNQSEKEAGQKRAGLTTSRSGQTNPSQRLKPWHTIGRRERADEEVHHDHTCQP